MVYKCFVFIGLDKLKPDNSILLADVLSAADMLIRQWDSIGQTSHRRWDECQGCLIVLSIVSGLMVTRRQLTNQFVIHVGKHSLHSPWSSLWCIQLCSFVNSPWQIDLPSSTFGCVFCIVIWSGIYMWTQTVSMFCSVIKRAGTSKIFSIQVGGGGGSAVVGKGDPSPLI